MGPKTQTLNSDTFKYIMTLDSIRRKYKNVPSWIRITTITMTCRFFADRIDIARIKEYFTTHKDVRIRRSGALTDGNKWTMRESPSEFYNQVTIGYEDAYTVKAIKVFPNGSFQVAGCADLTDCRRVCEQLGYILGSIFEHPMPADAFKVVMINTNFAMNQSVNLMEIFEKLGRSKKHRFEVSFNPDRYSAVKIKFQPRPNMKQVTASVFSTGKVIVTGAETLQEIVFAYDVLNSELLNVSTETKEDQTKSIFMGAEFGKWVPVLAARGIQAWA